MRSAKESSDVHIETKPTGVLLCDPLYFDVIDIKNPFMDPQAPVDKARARKQWSTMADAFRAAGANVVIMPGSPECEDMVFCANTALTGVDSIGIKRAVSSRMAYPSRQPEVEPTLAVLRSLGFSDTELHKGVRFEGGGDAIWHTGRHRVFGGFGYRSEAAAYEVVQKTFDCEIVPLTLQSPHFYHLDTCLCVIDTDTALAYPPAFSGESYKLLLTYFPNVIEVDEEEAMRFACNACAINGNVIIEQAAVRTIAELKHRGFNVFAVDTSEFMKSGGSVYCMKQYLF